MPQGSPQLPSVDMFQVSREGSQHRHLCARSSDSRMRLFRLSSALNAGDDTQPRSSFLFYFQARCRLLVTSNFWMDDNMSCRFETSLDIMQVRRPILMVLKERYSVACDKIRNSRIQGLSARARVSNRGNLYRIRGRIADQPVNRLIAANLWSLRGEFSHSQRF